MVDLIDRTAALDFKVSHGIHEDCEFYVPYGEVKQYLEQLPSAERKGHWIELKCGSASLWKCSECGELFLEDFYYCPNCGADMRGEQ